MDIKGSGKITTQKTVWCAGCHNHEVFDVPTNLWAEKEVRVLRWKRIDGLWFCPHCVWVRTKRD